MISLSCHSCDEAFKGEGVDAYKLGWRLWSLKSDRQLCPKCAKKRSERMLERARKKREQTA